MRSGFSTIKKLHYSAIILRLTLITLLATMILFLVYLACLIEGLEHLGAQYTDWYLVISMLNTVVGLLLLWKSCVPMLLMHLTLCGLTLFTSTVVIMYILSMKSYRDVDDSSKEHLGLALAYYTAVITLTLVNIICCFACGCLNCYNLFYEFVANRSLLHPVHGRSAMNGFWFTPENLSVPPSYESVVANDQSLNFPFNDQNSNFPSNDQNSNSPRYQSIALHQNALIY